MLEVRLRLPKSAIVWSFTHLSNLSQLQHVSHKRHVSEKISTDLQVGSQMIRGIR